MKLRPDLWSSSVGYKAARSDNLLGARLDRAESRRLSQRRNSCTVSRLMCLFGRPVHVTNRLSGANFPALIASWLELQPNSNLLCQLLPAQIHSIKPAPFLFPSPAASVSLGAGVCSNPFRTIIGRRRWIRASHPPWAVHCHLPPLLLAGSKAGSIDRCTTLANGNRSWLDRRAYRHRLGKSG